MESKSYLRKLREARPGILTQSQVAEACGMTKANYSKLENGLQGAQPKTIRKLAEYFGVDPAELRDKLTSQVA